MPTLADALTNATAAVSDNAQRFFDLESRVALREARAVLAAGQTPGVLGAAGAAGDNTSELAEAISSGPSVGVFGGTANDLTCSIAGGVVFAALRPMMEFWGTPAADNTGPVTILAAGFVAAPGKLPLKRRDGADLQQGDIQAGKPFRYRFDGTQYILRDLVPSERAAYGGGFRSDFRGLKGSSAGGVKTASFTIRQAIASTAAGLAFRGNNLSLNFDGSKVGRGGMDTGAMPVFTSAGTGWLVNYAIYNPTLDIWDILGCAGATSSGDTYTGGNMPPGFTASVLIGSYVTDGSGNLPLFWQADREVFPAAGNIIAAGLTASSLTALSLAAVIPPSAVSWTPVARMMAGSQPSNISLYGANSINSPDSGVGSYSADGVWRGGWRAALLGTTVYYSVSGSGANWTVGFGSYSF